MNNRGDLLLGADFGSGGCKLTVIDFSGRVIRAVAVEYPTYYEHADWSEQEPEDWFAGFCRALELLKNSGLELARIAAVALDGSTHNAVLLDAKMRPLRRTIMWTDQRSTLECAELAEFQELIFARTGQMPTPTWTLPQLRWLAKHEADILQRTRHVLFVKDFVRLQLTGVAETDYIEAQGSLLFDLQRREWVPELVGLAGIDMEIMPSLRNPWDVVGAISREVAGQTGLAQNTVVICGTSDSAAEDYGAGAIEPGDAIVKLATAGNFNVMTAGAVTDPRTLTYSHVIDGMYYSVAATNAAAVCLRWFRELVGTEFATLDVLAAASTPGANGMFFHPYLRGERCPYWDSGLRGSFTGIGMENQQGDFVRALLEGVAFSLRDCGRIWEELNLPVKRMILIGGGARSLLWQQILADVLNRELHIAYPGDASYGSALLAGVGIGVFDNPRSAVQTCAKIASTVTPDAGNAAFYAQKYNVYCEIHDALAGVRGLRSKS